MFCCFWILGWTVFPFVQNVVEHHCIDDIFLTLPFFLNILSRSTRVLCRRSTTTPASTTTGWPMRRWFNPFMSWRRCAFVPLRSNARNEASWHRWTALLTCRRFVVCCARVIWAPPCWTNPGTCKFIVHVGGTRCVTSSTDNNLKILARITLTVEFIRTCIFLCLCYVWIQLRVWSILTFFRFYWFSGTCNVWYRGTRELSNPTIDGALGALGALLDDDVWL